MPFGQLSSKTALRGVRTSRRSPRTVYGLGQVRREECARQHRGRRVQLHGCGSVAAGPRTAIRDGHAAARATGGVAVAWRRTRVRSAGTSRKNSAVGRVAMRLGRFGDTPPARSCFGGGKVRALPPAALRNFAPVGRFGDTPPARVCFARASANFAGICMLLTLVGIQIADSQGQDTGVAECRWASSRLVKVYSAPEIPANQHPTPYD